MFLRIFLLEQKLLGERRGKVYVACIHPDIFWVSHPLKKHPHGWEGVCLRVPISINGSRNVSSRYSWHHFLVHTCWNYPERKFWQWILLLTERGHMLNARQKVSSMKRQLFFQRLYNFAWSTECASRADTIGVRAGFQTAIRFDPHIMHVFF